MSTINASPSPALAASFEHCAEITRRRARNFHYGLRLTPQPKRSALYALYAWSRLGDDIVDGDAEDFDRRQRLAEFATQTERAMHDEVSPGNGTNADLWPAFAESVRRYGIEPALPRAMIDGLRFDLSGEPVRTRDDLFTYCDQVASTVGIMCVRVWGLADPGSRADADRLATARGRAFQMTNILRDVAGDLAMSPPRFYLPSDSLEDAGLSPRSLQTWNDPVRCRRFIVRWVEDARAQFNASAGLEAMVTPNCRPTLRAMTAIYRGILERIADEPRLVVGPRPVSLSGWTKARIALSMLVGGRGRP